MVPLAINEFLCFVSVQFDKLDRENLVSTLIDFYSYEEALLAKETLISECDKILINDSIKDFKAKRREAKAGTTKKVVEDVIDIWSVVDREKAGQLSVLFVAANPNRLPSVNVEKFNLQFLIASIIKLQEQLNGQQTILRVINERLDTPPPPLASTAPASIFAAALPTPTLSTSVFGATASSSTSNSALPTLPSHTIVKNLVDLETPPPGSKRKKRKLSGSAPAFTPASAKERQKSHTLQLGKVSVPASFADQARQLDEKQKPWTLVQARKNKNIVPVVGKGEISILEGVAPPVKDFWEISVSRLSEATTEDKVKTFLQKHGIEVREVYVFPSRIKGTVSSKIRVALDYKQKVKDENIWPPHCRVQVWINRPKYSKKKMDDA
jgi:hypothetical protein